MRTMLVSLAVAGCVLCAAAAPSWPGDDRGEYLGQFSANPYDPDSTSNRFGAGNPANPDSINNPTGRYGSATSPHSANNRFASDAPRLYDAQGNFRGTLSENPFDPDSVNNPFGRYGSRFSSDSVNNPFGAGNRFDPDSPNNPHGRGWEVRGQ